MDVVLAPDIYVNASIALDSPPDRAVRRAFGGPGKPKTSTWVLERVQSMLHAVPEFKDEALAQQMATIRDLVEVVETQEHFIEAWSEALGALAEAAGALPYREDLVGNPETGVLHGGCITSLIDATCGGAVILSLVAPRRVATLDLRIDYVRPALPHQEVICGAHCYKVTRNVAFVRASAHHGDIASPIATASGTFVVFRDDGRREDDRGLP